MASTEQLVDTLLDKPVEPLPALFLAKIASFDSATGLYTLALPNGQTTTKKYYPLRSAFAFGAFAVNDVVLVWNGGSFLQILDKVNAHLNLALNAPKWGGVQWATPGNTNTEVTQNTEQSFTGSTFTAKKRWTSSRPGCFRVTFDLKKSTSDTAEARVIWKTPSGDIIIISGTASEFGTSYTAKSLDTSVAVPMGAELHIQIRNTGGGSAEVRNNVVKFDNAASAPTLAAQSLED